MTDSVKGRFGVPMSTLLLLAALLLPQAEAAAPKDVGVATLEGVVEVPLYPSESAEDPTWFVEATVGETTLWLRVATARDGVALTTAAAKKIGKKPTGEDKAFTFDLALGAAAFGRVKATAADDIKGADGEIGLGAFPSLAWAVLPSKGVLRVARASEAAALRAGLSGVTASYEDVPKRKVKLGSGEPVEIGRGEFVLRAKVSGVELGVELGAVLVAERSSTRVLREAEGLGWFSIKGTESPATPLPPVAARELGEATIEWRDVAVGGRAVAMPVRREGGGVVGAMLPKVTLGGDWLAGTDWVVDSAAHELLFVAATPAPADRVAREEAILRKALEPKPPKEGATPDPKAEATARAGSLAALAALLEREGRWTEALVSRVEASTLQGDACVRWLELGEAQLAVGAPDAAVEPLRRAMELYAPWAALDLEQRRDLEKQAAAAAKKKSEWTGQKSQDHRCHVAAGRLALAQALSGAPAAAAELYPARLDLDAYLPLAAGTAAWISGDTTAAAAAWRQSIERTRDADQPGGRAGLFLATRGDDAARARAQLERVWFTDVEGAADPLAVRRWVESVGAAGPQRLTDLLARDPSNPALLAEAARVAAAGGDTATAARHAATLEGVAQTKLAYNPNDARWLAYRALAALRAGDAAQAAALAKRATDADASSALAWLATADVSAASGDSAGVASSTRRAALAGAWSPLWADLLRP